MTDNKEEEIKKVDEQDKPLDQEKNLQDFFNTRTLADIELVNPSTESKKKIHKVILASGSKYFLEILRTADERPAEEVKEEKDKLNEIYCPKPIPTSFDAEGACSDENINRILKYLYYN